VLEVIDGILTKNTLKVQAISSYHLEEGKINQSQPAEHAKLAENMFSKARKDISEIMNH